MDGRFPIAAVDQEQTEEQIRMEEMEKQHAIDCATSAHE